MCAVHTREGKEIFLSFCMISDALRFGLAIFFFFPGSLLDVVGMHLIKKILV